MHGCVIPQVQHCSNQQILTVQAMTYPSPILALSPEVITLFDWHVAVLQELCQRLQSFFSNAKQAQQESTTPDAPFAISYKVVYFTHSYKQQCVSHTYSSNNSNAITVVSGTTRFCSLVVQ